MVFPASKAVAERVFSISCNIWSFHKSQMCLEILKSLLIIKSNFEMEFEIYLSNRPNTYKKKLQSAEKYQK